jgi:hypothetical protein
MGQKSFISDADKALSTFIWNSLKNELPTKNLISRQEQISFSSPKTADNQGTRKLSIFLYSITEETTARNAPPAADFSANKPGAASFALHYLVTPLTGNDKDDHELLEKIVHAVLTAPLIHPDEGNTVALTVKIDSLSLDELSKLWNALDAPLRLSVSLTVSSAETQHDSQAQVAGANVAAEAQGPDMKRVTQLYQAVLKTFIEQSSGWRSRNMVVKEWVFQNFNKKTNMTVDEMQTALNNLGDRLKQHGSTAQFIEPLNLLAGYYEHQLDQLKGLHKFSHGQRENIEAISVWIKDIKALVEALTAGAS